MDRSTKIKLAILIVMFALLAMFGVGLRIYMNNELENQTGQVSKPYSVATAL